MLGSKVFSRVTAWTGILANIFELGYYIMLIFAPTQIAIPFYAASPLLMIWYILVGWTLLRLQPAEQATCPSMQTSA